MALRDDRNPHCYLLDIRENPKYKDWFVEDTIDNRRYTLDDTPEIVGRNAYMRNEEIYTAVENVVLLTEDIPEMRRQLEVAALKSLNPKTTPFILVAKDAKGSTIGSSLFANFSPNACGYSVLDYDMSENDRANQETTDILFAENGPFIRLAKNGGVTVFYTGHPATVFQPGSAVADFARAYEDRHAVFWGAKGTSEYSVSREEVFTAINFGIKNPELIPELAKASRNVNYNLKELVESLRLQM